MTEGRYENVTVKLRGEDAILIKQVAARANAKIIDVVKLWPRCPKCGFPLTQISKKIFCLKCGREHKLVEA